jgi:hypothetical protein
MSMRARLPVWLLALAGSALVMWRGTWPTEDIYWSDFGTEAWPAFEALARGDVSGFLARSPVGYGGSMLLRAPLAAFGGSEPTVYRLGALVCVLALAGLAAHLAVRARERFPGERWWLLVVALGAASPIAWTGVWMGHPEELLTAALAVGAVLVARSDRPLLAGAMLGLAFASKQWAVLAVLPAVLAAPRRQPRLLAAAAALAAVALAPLVLAAPDGAGAAQHVAASSANWFYPRQLWWPLGAPLPAGVDQPAGSAATPAWLAPLAKPLIVAVALPLALGWWLRAGRAARDRTDALLLLALVLLVRCMLDPWNVIYYELPVIAALLAWEVERGHRLPLLTLAVTGAVWLSFSTYDAAVGYGPWLAFLAWSVPLAGLMGWALYFGGAARLTARSRQHANPVAARGLGHLPGGTPIAT